MTSKTSVAELAVNGATGVFVLMAGAAALVVMHKAMHAPENCGARQDLDDEAEEEDGEDRPYDPDLGRDYGIADDTGAL